MLRGIRPAARAVPGGIDETGPQRDLQGLLQKKTVFQMAILFREPQRAEFRAGKQLGAAAQARAHERLRRRRVRRQIERSGGSADRQHFPFVASAVGQPAAD